MSTGSATMHPSLRDVLSILFYHKWKVLLCFIVTVTVITAATFVSPEIYESQAKLLLRLGRENLQVDPSVSGPTLSVNRDRESELNSEISIFTSNALAEKLVDAVGPEVFLSGAKDEQPGAGAQELLRSIRRVAREAKSSLKSILVALDILTPLSPREKAIQSVSKSLTVQAEKRTNILTARFEADQPLVAQQMLDQLMRLYLEHHIKVYASQASPQFFEGQAEKLREELLEREEELARFRERNQIANMEGQKQVLLGQMDSTQRELDSAISQISAAEARTASLKSAIGKRAKTLELSRTTGRTNYAADSLKALLMDLQLKETALASRYPGTHPPLIELRRQIQQTNEALAKEQKTLTEVTTGIDSTTQDLTLSLESEQAELQAQQARAALLRQNLDERRKELAALVSHETELAARERDVELAEKEFKQYREDLQRARISTALDIDKVSNVSVVQAATLPEAPKRPNKILNLALGVLLGVFGGVLWAFGIEYFSDTLSRKEDVERRLGVPLLTVVSEKEFKACI